MEFNIAHHTLLWEVSVLKNSQKFWPETQNPLTIGSVMIVKLDMVKWNISNKLFWSMFFMILFVAENRQIEKDIFKHSINYTFDDEIKHTNRQTIFTHTN